MNWVSDGKTLTRVSGKGSVFKNGGFHGNWAMIHDGRLRYFPTRRKAREALKALKAGS